MKELRISKDLALPRDTVTSTLIVYGGKGMGKTVFGSVLAEELTACSLRWAWLDPLGVAHGLRYSADGAGKGIECLILGGVHGDIPIEPTGGAAVADVVVDESVNVVIDFSRKPSGEMWGVGERIRFATDYAKRLFRRQGEIVSGRRREPLMQFLDEGARYIPQIVPAGNPELGKCIAAWQQVVEEGRNIGLGLCVLTQRSARINKDVAELADAMVAFRTVGPNSLGAVLDWLGEHVERSRLRDLSAQVRELPRGTALIVSPGWLSIEKIVPIRMRNTFDSSATPKPGQRVASTKGDGAKPDLEQIRVRMAETIERAKADDPKALRARIAELEKAVAAKATKITTSERVEVPVFDELRFQREDDFAAERIGAACKAVQAALDAALQAKGDVARSLSAYGKEMRRAAKAPTGRATQPSAVRAPSTPPAPAPASNPSVARGSGAGDASLGKCERSLLAALAQHGTLTLTQAAIIAHYSMSSSGPGIAAARLRGLLYVDGDNATGMTITEAGLQALGEHSELPTGPALLAWWCRELGKCEAAILAEAAARYPEAVSLREAAEAHGYSLSSSGPGIAAAKLRTLRLVHGSNAGMTADKRLV